MNHVLEIHDNLQVHTGNGLEQIIQKLHWFNNDLDVTHNPTIPRHAEINFDGTCLMSEEEIDQFKKLLAELNDRVNCPQVLEYELDETEEGVFYVGPPDKERHTLSSRVLKDLMVKVHDMNEYHQKELIKYVRALLKLKK